MFSSGTWSAIRLTRLTDYLGQQATQQFSLVIQP
jgi:hypothetical protein